MSDLSRVEQLLRNALGDDIYEVTPQSRVEALLAELNELIEGMGGGSVSPEDIATAVSAYLGEHLTNYVQFTDLATASRAGVMSAQDKGRLDDVYADYSSALTALGVS